VKIADSAMIRDAMPTVPRYGSFHDVSASGLVIALIDPFLYS
jgi:hypothetical protein